MQRQATEGPGTPAVASSMMQLAVVYDAVDQPTAAVSMYTRAASVLEAIYGTTSDMCPPLSAMGGMLMRRSQCVVDTPPLSDTRRISLSVLCSQASWIPLNALFVHGGQVRGGAAAPGAGMPHLGGEHVQ